MAATSESIKPFPSFKIPSNFYHSIVPQNGPISTEMLNLLMLNPKAICNEIPPATVSKFLPSFISKCICLLTIESYLLVLHQTFQQFVLVVQEHA